MIVNWLGNNSFSNPTVNNWSVASAGFLQKIFGPLVEHGGAMIAILDKATADLASRFCRVNVDALASLPISVYSNGRYEMTLLVNCVNYRFEILMKDTVAGNVTGKKIYSDDLILFEYDVLFGSGKSAIVEHERSLVVGLSYDEKRVQLAEIDNATVSLRSMKVIGEASNNTSMQSSVMLPVDGGYVICWMQKNGLINVRKYNQTLAENGRCELALSNNVMLLNAVVWQNRLLLGYIEKSGSESYRYMLRYIDLEAMQPISEVVNLGLTVRVVSPIYFSEGGHKVVAMYNKMGSWVSVVCEMTASPWISEEINHDVLGSTENFSDCLFVSPTLQVFWPQFNKHFLRIIF